MTVITEVPPLATTNGGFACAHTFDPAGAVSGTLSHRMTAAAATTATRASSPARLFPIVVLHVPPVTASPPPARVQAGRAAPWPLRCGQRSATPPSATPSPA